MRKHAVDLLLVRGAPGVGKSTAVRTLRKHIGSGAVVEVDHVRGMIADVRWVDTAHHLAALGVTRGIIHSFLSRGFRPVIVVDTFSGGKLRQFVADLAEETYVRYRVASLHAAADTLLARVAGRPTNEYREPDVSLLLNDEVLRNRHPREELIDTTHLSPGDVAKLLLEILERLE
jgi:tRNA uridine 5-carbamoylmethylation protein Kti12